MVGELHAPVALPLGKDPPVTIGWAPESVWTLWRREKPLASPGIEPRPSSPELTRLHRDRIIPSGARNFLGPVLHVPDAGQPCSRIKFRVTKCYVAFTAFIFNISFKTSETKYGGFH
jgi:hypothetical protein